MKKLGLLLFLSLFAAAFVVAQEVQTEELSEVVVMPVNYRYLNQVDHKEAPVPVRLLQQEAADYDIRSEDFYQDDFSHYTVSFYIPDGKLVAVYNQEGEIIRTIEKFKNIDVPRAVVRSIKNHYPDWELISDVYHVKYEEAEEIIKKYKLKLQRGNKVIRVSMNEAGDVL